MRSKPTNAASIHGSVTKCETKIDKRPSPCGKSGVSMIDTVKEMRRRVELKRKAAETRERLNLESRLRAEGR